MPNIGGIFGGLASIFNGDFFKNFDLSSLTKLVTSIASIIPGAQPVAAALEAGKLVKDVVRDIGKE